MTIGYLIELLKTHPEDVQFEQVMNVIAENYDYSPMQFINGIGDDQVINKSGENEGSCKLFAFAKMNGLSESETLTCFGDYYRNDVLQNKETDNHANIRTFMRHGWAGIHFENPALALKYPLS